MNLINGPMPNTDMAVQRYEAIQQRLPRADFPAQSIWRAHLGELVDDIDCFVLDGFGVLNIGEQAVPGAVVMIAPIEIVTGLCCWEPATGMLSVRVCWLQRLQIRPDRCGLVILILSRRTPVACQESPDCMHMRSMMPALPPRSSTANLLTMLSSWSEKHLMVWIRHELPWWVILCIPIFSVGLRRVGKPC